MRYYHEKHEGFCKPVFGKTYICDHPLYDKCTLYKIFDKGLAVVQERFDPVSKRRYWSEIDPELVNELYLDKGFIEYFHRMAGQPENDIYPTVTIRQIMWALKMKPLKKELWEKTPL